MPYEYEDEGQPGARKYCQKRACVTWPFGLFISGQLQLRSSRSTKFSRAPGAASGPSAHAGGGGGGSANAYHCRPQCVCVRVCCARCWRWRWPMQRHQPPAGPSVPFALCPVLSESTVLEYAILYPKTSQVTTWSQALTSVERNLAATSPQFTGVPRGLCCNSAL
jgi:hypothetical protein